MDFCNVDDCIAYAKKIGATDIHIKCGEEALCRKGGRIQKMDLWSCGYDYEPCRYSHHDIMSFLRSGNLGLSGKQLEDIEKPDFMSMDVAYPGKNIRINIFRDSDGLGMALRILPDKIPSMDELRLPPAVRDFANCDSGLVIVSGPTGSGKTTTLASLLSNINKNQAKHIITIEDPVEYRICSQQSLVTQRNVGIHCESFASGLRDALRQDPDVILVGEMRDAETILTAMQAAETGHLVFTTLHAGNTMEAIDRFSQYFPAEKNLEIRNQLANCLHGIVAQKLLLAAGGDKTMRVAAFEVLLTTDAIRAVIRSGKTFRLQDYMSGTRGMMTMMQSIEGLKTKHILQENHI